MAVTAETFRLLRFQQEAINATVAKLDGRIQRVWYSIRADLGAQDWAHLTARQRSNLAAALNTQFGQRLELMAQETKRTARELADQAWSHQQELANSQVPTQIHFQRPDPQAEAWMQTRTTRRIESKLRPLAYNAQQELYSQMRRGMAEGANPREVARRTISNLNAMYDTLDGGMARALNIARTETLDAYRDSAQITQQANADILSGWVWVAKLSSRTCRSCWAKHGQEFPLSVPGPHDHPQGRCARVPKTKSWKELGFDGVEDDDTDLLSSKKEFGRLTEDQQRMVLGDDGFEAWKAGKYPIHSWSQLEEPAGWRPFYRASKPPKVSPRPEMVSPKPSKPSPAPTPAPAPDVPPKSWKERHAEAKARYDRGSDVANAQVIYNPRDTSYRWGLNEDGSLSKLYQGNLDAVMDAGKQVETEWYSRVSKRLGAPPDALASDTYREIASLNGKIDELNVKMLGNPSNTSAPDQAAWDKMVNDLEGHITRRDALQNELAKIHTQRDDAMQAWLQQNPRKLAKDWRNMAAKAEGEELQAVLNDLGLQLGTNRLKWADLFLQGTDKIRIPKLLEAAERLYPRSWVERAASKNRRVVLRKEKRGYNAKGGAEIALSDTGAVRGIGDINHVAIHELGHSMEAAVPGLSQLEWAFLRSRNVVYDPYIQKWLMPKQTAIYAGTREMGWKDDFKEHYTGKAYGGDNWELFTTGIESLWAGSGYLDREFRRWLLGVLTVL